MTLPATPTPRSDTFLTYDALTRLLFDYADAHPCGAIAHRASPGAFGPTMICKPPRAVKNCRSLITSYLDPP